MAWQIILSATLHIRYGYEALDRNMQVIKNCPYNAAQDIQQSARRSLSLAKSRI